MQAFAVVETSINRGVTIRSFSRFEKLGNFFDLSSATHQIHQPKHTRNYNVNYNVIQPDVDVVRSVMADLARAW